MNILIVLGHPSEASFNHAIAIRAKNRLEELGHEVIFHDLYQEKFNPIVLSEEIPRNGKLDDTIQKHCEDLSNVDGIIIIHPNWWGQPPAIMKGWIDRVIRPGVAYGFADGDTGEGVPIGLLKAKIAIVFNTSNTSEKRENEVFQDPLQLIWKNCIFDLCGIKYFYRKMFRILVTSTLEERNMWLDDVEQIIDKYFFEK